jgi:hypothetical protein
MRWSVFAIFAFVLLVLEVGLCPLLHVSGGLGWVCPSFLLILGAFVATWAPGSVVLWAMLILGFLVDLQPLPVGDGVTVAAIIGPHSLGFLLGGFAMLQVRTLFYRDSLLALAAMVFVGGIFVHLAAVALLTARGIALPFLSDPVAGWNTADQLFHRFWQLVYSATAAVPVGYVLRRCQRLFGFEGAKGMVRRLG